MTKQTYNPLDKLSLAKSIESEVISGEVEPLEGIKPIVGAGVYVIYYRGRFEPYSSISAANSQEWKQPIYVGKAIPRGGRKGSFAKDVSLSGTALQSRLRKHVESIRATENLTVNEFCFRYIILDDIWIPLGENILIEKYRPLWNIAIDGFGINDPGKGRLQQRRSAWDVLHPGRLYAGRLTGGAPELEVVMGRVDDHFRGRALRTLPRSIDVPERPSSDAEDEAG